MGDSKILRCQEFGPDRPGTTPAARVFEEQGIGGASIEAIAAAAGFTRGAFYSNFTSKNQLIIAMLGDHVEQCIRGYLELLASREASRVSSKL